MRAEADARALFAAQIGGQPAAVASAPGRVNLIGEHTDYNEGLVLPVPLPLGTTVALAPRDDGQLVATSELDGRLVRRAMGEQASGSWTDYLLGAAREVGWRAGLSVAVVSDLPAGASVSSSAALCVAAIRALDAAMGRARPGAAVAREAQAVENRFVGVACGLMDQMVSACGVQGHALFFDTRSGATRPIPLIPGTTLLTIHSGQTRRLADGAYNRLRQGCERAAAAIGVAALRDATEADLARVPDAADRALARHVISENARVLAAVAALEAGDAPRLGAILNEGHASLSRDFGVSTEHVDRLCAAARDGGALGARITGAGFGGCFIALATPHTADAVLAAVADCGGGGARLVSRIDA